MAFEAVSIYAHSDRAMVEYGWYTALDLTNCGKCMIYATVLTSLGHKENILNNNFIQGGTSCSSCTLTGSQGNYFLDILYEVAHFTVTPVFFWLP